MTLLSRPKRPRDFLRGLAVLSMVLLTGCSSPPRQAPAKVHRIGFLSNAPLEALPIEALRQGLRELGYVEGQNIAIEFRSARATQERLPGLATELVNIPVEVIVASGNPSIIAAKKATSTIAVVMAQSNDPVAAGLVASLAQPGGNITGLSLKSLELSGKRLELFKEAVPGLSRVALFWNPSDPALAAVVTEMERAARALKVEILPLTIRRPKDYEPALRAASAGGANGLIAVRGSVVVSERDRFLELVAKAHLPAMYAEVDYVGAGGLMAYGPSIAFAYGRAAFYIDKILKGAKPSELPVEQADKIDFAINLKTARALRLTIPESVLLRATSLIK